MTTGIANLSGIGPVPAEGGMCVINACSDGLYRTGEHGKIITVESAIN